MRIGCDLSRSPTEMNESKSNERATVDYYSKTLKKEQRNYAATRKECYAVVGSVLTLSPYLERLHF